MTIPFEVTPLIQKHQEEMKDLLKGAFMDIAQKMQSTSLQTILFKFIKYKDEKISISNVFYTKLDEKGIRSNFDYRHDGFTSEFYGSCGVVASKDLKFGKAEAELINEVEKFVEMNKENILKIINHDKDTMMIHPTKIKFNFGDKQEKIAVELKFKKPKLGL